MAKTKFIVISMKDILKNGLFVLIGLVAIISLIFVFIPKGTDDGQSAQQENYNSGTYKSAILIDGNSVEVVVTIDDGFVTDVVVANLTPELETFYPLIQPTIASIKEHVISNQNTEIAFTNDNVHTGTILVLAVNDALSQAKQ